MYAYQPRKFAIWRLERRESRDGCGRVPERKQRFSEGKVRVIWRKEATPLVGRARDGFSKVSDGRTSSNNGLRAVCEAGTVGKAVQKR